MTDSWWLAPAFLLTESLVRRWLAGDPQVQLDTGAPEKLIDDETARRLSVAPSRQPFRSMGFVSVIIVSGLFALALPVVVS